MKTFLKNNFQLIIILVLVCIIFLQRCGNAPVSQVAKISDRDKCSVTYKTIKKTEIVKVPVYKTDTLWKPGDIVYKPDTNYAGLLQQYKDLFKYYTMRVIYKDTIAIEEYGYVEVIDTVHNNQLCDRKYNYNLNIPTYQYLPKRQIYVGGEITVQYPIAFNHIQASILYKDRKDRMFGITAGLQHELKPYFGVATYWKIRLR